MKPINFGTPEEFTARYNELKSSRKMAEFYNCSKGAVLNYAKKIGYDNSGNRFFKIKNIPIEQVIKDYETLQDCKKVGELYGCTERTVQDYLREHNYNFIKKTNPNNKSQNFDIDTFIADYQELKSAEKMGQKYNCSATTILRFAQKINYDVSTNKRKLSEEERQYIIDSYNNKTSNELAKELNINRGTVTKIWHDNNLIGKETAPITTVEKDITGQDFGYWHVMYKTNKRHSNGSIMWHCKCKCGVERDVNGSSLRLGLSLSCGNHKNISKGNYLISQLLLEAEIPFETEKEFLTCKDKTPLPFDFFVNNSYLIEYDGIQHFEETIFDYDYTHNHDLIKSKWCKDNNIPLIRIPYTHFNDLNLNDLLLETSNFIEK